jgi:hypothetical protein
MIAWALRLSSCGSWLVFPPFNLFPASSATFQASTLPRENLSSSHSKCTWSRSIRRAERQANDHDESLLAVLWCMEMRGVVDRLVGGVWVPTQEVACVLTVDVDPRRVDDGADDVETLNSE